MSASSTASVSRVAAVPLPGPSRARWVWPWVAAAVVLVVVVVSASTRWSGELPLGSDNDEYRMVAERLREGRGPLVAGVEGTKYPLGYPLLLAAIGLLRLPVTETALLLNVVAIAGTAALVALTVRRLGLSPLAGFAAAFFVAANPALWTSAHSVMVDVLLVLLSAAVLLVLVRTSRVRDVLVLTLLAAAATSLKSVGLLVAIGVSAGLLVRPGLRRWSPLPALGGLAAAAASARAVASYPEHTTGYEAWFWLVDPRDASRGRAGPAEVLARLWQRWDQWLSDLGHGLTAQHAPETGAVVAGVVLVLAGLVLLGRCGRAGAIWPVLGFCGAYTCGLLLWPTGSFRFGEPFLPLAALGVAMVAASTARLRSGRVAVAAVLLLYAAWGWGQMSAEAAADRAQYSAVRQGLDRVQEWAGRAVRPDDLLVAFDYREVSARLARPVLPLGYTADVAVLRERSVGRGADWLVVLRGLHPLREQLAGALVAARPEEFLLVLDDPRVLVYRVGPGPAAGRPSADAIAATSTSRASTSTR